VLNPVQPQFHVQVFDRSRDTALFILSGNDDRKQPDRRGPMNPVDPRTAE
jgi:hypothetical protein